MCRAFVVPLSVAMVLGLLPGSARAADETISELRQPATIGRLVYQDRDDFTLAEADPPRTAAGTTAGGSEATEPPSEMPPPPITGGSAEAGGAGPAPAGPQPWTIPQPQFLQNMGIKMGGWLQQGITFNADKPGDGFNGPVTTNDFDRQYQMNQLWLYFVRPTKTDGCGTDLGGRVDVVYGSDWRFGQQFGLENRINDPNGFYGLVLPQFYFEVAVNDLTVKLGHFATLTSYEVVPAPLNFFYSHTYLMAGYFDPLLVTGLQADYKLDDNWTAVGGFNRGWGMFEDPTETLNFLGGARWASDDKRSTLAAMVDTGPQIGFTGLHDRTSCYIVFTHQLTEKLLYATQHTAGIEEGGSIVDPGANAQWYGMGHWFIYSINPQWSAGLRYEWVRDNDGSRIAGIGNLLGTNKGWDGLPGFAGSFHDLSLGLNYRPCPNTVFRPEVRYDWYSGPANVGAQLPFDGDTKTEQFTFAMDLIVTF